jgi:hypothetical protein
VKRANQPRPVPVLDPRGFAEMPRGRILYTNPDVRPFVVLWHDRSDAFYIAEDGWSSQSPTAGPFDPRDILRAWRLANVRVPDGCERGPWQWGINLFKLAPVPHPSERLRRHDPTWLSPSVSAYSGSDIDSVVNEICCAPAHDAPRVNWGALGSTYGLRELRQLARLRFPDAGCEAAGLLKREWNAHPVGSAVLARSETLLDAFLVVDLPPTQ